jgi:predicted ATPase/DNA-binding SARP family transcriptional activator
VRVDVLGSVSVRTAAATVSGRALGGRRAHIVLAALAVTDHPISPRQLAERVWPGGVPTTWDAALRGVIHGLRTALTPAGAGGDVLIVTAANGYALASGTVVDVGEAADAVRQATQFLHDGRPEAALEAASGPATIDPGALLADEDAEWLVEQRAALDALRRQAGHLAVEAATRTGDHRTAVAFARRAVAHAPLDEAAAQDLIRALDRAGDRSGAVLAYEQCRTALAEELGIDPSADTVAAYLAALRSDPLSGRDRMPVATTTFRGRVDELTQVRAAAAEPGVVTVIGTGGVGKSRLVQQALAGYDGAQVHWVALGTTGDDELVEATIALALGATVGGNAPVDAIAGRLAPLGRTILVMDGCEQAIDGCASAATALTESCPQLTILATSRMPLGLTGERVLPLDALSGDLPALLLADRLAERGEVLPSDDEVRPLVEQLCRRCAGLPLALELAAAQLSAMSVPDLLDQLDEAAAGNGRSDDPLPGVLDHSYRLLDADEAAVFRRLAVLDGPTGLPLIRAVVTDTDVAPTRVVRILRELTARGLVLLDRSQPRWRYHQDDDLHRFAADQLRRTGEQTATYRRLAMALRNRLPDDPRAAPAPYRDEISAVLESVRSLLSAASDGRVERSVGLELAFRLHRYFASTNVAEGRFWLERLLAGAAVDAAETAPDGVPTWRAQATFALGYLLYWSGDSHALPVLEEAATRLQGVDDALRARTLVFLAGIADDVDRGLDAVGFVHEAIAITERLAEPDLHVSAVIGVGCILAERTDPAAARYAADAIALCRAGVSAEQLAATLPTAAMICWQVGEHDQAAAYLAEALPLHEQKRIAYIVLLCTAAGLALSRGDVAAAIEYGRTADDQATELGVEREIPLIRAVLAQAHLDAGDVVAAARVALATVDAAAALTFEFPHAIALETAALALVAGARCEPAVIAELFAAAEMVRDRGDRPAAPSLRARRDGARAAVADALVTARVPTLPDAVTVARNELARLIVDEAGQLN